MDIVNHSAHSTLRERIVEHVFVGDALRTLWKRGVTDVEVLRSEFDAHGYDLVMSRGSIVRHIQFKTGVRPKPLRVSVSSALANKPSGCVIWIQVTLGLDLGPYWWLGGNPGEPLPSLEAYPNPQRIGRNAEGNRPLRVGHRRVPGSAFSMRPDMDSMLETLFGPIESLGPPMIAEDNAENG